MKQGSLLALLAAPCVALTQVPGYSAYSWNPAMGYSVKPSSYVLKEGAVKSVTVEVTDGDEYRRDSDGAIIQLWNSAIGVEWYIRSGTVGSPNSAFDATTGKRTVIVPITARDVPDLQLVTYIDEYQAVDNGTTLIVKDARGDVMYVQVQVAGKNYPLPPSTL